MMSSPASRVGIRFGLYLGAAEIAYGLAFRLAGLDSRSPLSWIFYLMLPVAVWVAHRAYRTGAPSMSYRQGLGIGALTTTIGSVLYCIQVWLYNRFVDDSLLLTVRQVQMEALSAQRTGAELDAAIAGLDLFLQPAMFALIVCLQLIVAGAASALLISLVSRRSAAG